MSKCVSCGKILDKENWIPGLKDDGEKFCKPGCRDWFYNGHQYPDEYYEGE